MNNAPINFTKPMPGQTCVCVDPQHLRMLDLMAAGHTQPEASRIVWGDPPAPAPEPDPAPRPLFRWIGSRERSC